MGLASLIVENGLLPHFDTILLKVLGPYLIKVNFYVGLFFRLVHFIIKDRPYLKPINHHQSWPGEFLDPDIYASLVDTFFRCVSVYYTSNTLSCG